MCDFYLAIFKGANYKVSTSLKTLHVKVCYFHGMKSILLSIIILSNQCVFAQSLVFVFLHHKTDKAELPKEQVDKIMEGHMANIQKMAKEGKLLVAGPFEGGGG